MASVAEMVGQPLAQPTLDATSRDEHELAGERSGRRSLQELGECVGEEVGPGGAVQDERHADRDSTTAADMHSSTLAACRAPSRLRPGLQIGRSPHRRRTAHALRRRDSRGAHPAPAPQSAVHIDVDDQGFTGIRFWSDVRHGTHPRQSSPVLNRADRSRYRRRHARTVDGTPQLGRRHAVHGRRHPVDVSTTLTTVEKTLTETRATLDETKASLGEVKGLLEQLSFQLGLLEQVPHLVQQLDEVHTASPRGLREITMRRLFGGSILCVCCSSRALWRRRRLASRLGQADSQDDGGAGREPLSRNVP